MGSFAGYYSARLFKVFKGTAWKRNAVLTAILFPGTLFGLMFLLNFFVWGEEASNAIPFGTMLALCRYLVSLWLAGCLFSSPPRPQSRCGSVFLCLLSTLVHTLAKRSKLLSTRFGQTRFRAKFRNKSGTFNRYLPSLFRA